MKDHKQMRTKWSSTFGFILACVGSAVGLGNIWKFPYITYESGGGAFVLIYLVAIALVGFPIMVAEVSIGKKAKANAYSAFKKLSNDNLFWKLAGGLTILSPFLILTYYSVVAGWTVEYCIQALLGNLSHLTTETAGARFSDFASSGWKQVGYHTFFMVLTSVIVVREIKGIEVALKYIMPVFFTLIFVIAGYSLYEYGGTETFNFLFSFKAEQITPHAVLEAVGHAFFTLSVAAGMLVIYGSHVPEDTDLVKTSLWIVLLDTLVAIMACFMMYPIIFGSKMDVGASLSILFTSLTAQFNALPGGSFVLGLFFLLVALAALSSTISILEAVVSFVVERAKMNRVKATILTSSVIWLIGVLCALGLGANDMLTKLNLFDRFDYVVSNWTMPIGGFLISIFFGWVVGDKYFKDEFNNKHHEFLYPVLRFMLRYVSPLLVGIVILYKLGVF